MRHILLIACMYAFSAFNAAYCQSSSGTSTIVRIAGGGTPFGLSLLLTGLENDSRLEWRSVTVGDQEGTISAVLSRANGWPAGSISLSTDSLICGRNPHVCCPIPEVREVGIRSKCVAELKKIEKGHESEFLIAAHKICESRRINIILNSSKNEVPCESIWRFSSSSNSRTSIAACGKMPPSTSQLCLPNIKVREHIGVQEFPFNPDKDKSIRSKYEEMQGCSELTKEEKQQCQDSYSTQKLNVFNYGNYIERARKEGKVTMPVRAYSIDIPGAPALDAARPIEQTMESIRSTRDALNRPSLNIDWLQRQDNRSVRPQQVATSAEEIQAAQTIQALKQMGFDDKGPSVRNLPPILAMDLSPLFKGNPRLPENTVNAFGIHEIDGRQAKCPTGSQIGFKPVDWISRAKGSSLDHATEVMGIMAAKLDPSSKVFGAIASVIDVGNIHSLYIDDGKGEPDDQTTVEAIMTIGPVGAFTAKCATKWPVVNVSLKFSSTTQSNLSSEYEGVLIGRVSESQFALFVVAAGNPDSSTSIRAQSVESCNHLPGCKAISSQNMISVIGLNSEGNKPSRASFHGPPFEVGAIGDVWTVNRRGKETLARGSSYAAPFVTSLASLIIGKAWMLMKNGGMIQPADVKTRILQTVDFLQDDNAVRFGRINFSRALEIERDIVATSRKIDSLEIIRAPYCANPNICYAGKVDKSDRIKNLVGFDPDGNKIAVSDLDFERVLRLRRRSNDKWDVIYLPITRDALTPQRIKNAEFSGISEITIEVNGNRTSVPISSLTDYTRCMWRKGNDGNCFKGR